MSTSVLVRDEAAQERYYIASQWQLVRWKFLQHRLAMASLAVLTLFYLVAAFAEFVAPYDPRDFEKELVLAPPQWPRFVDEEGRLHLRPFVYQVEKSVDRTTWQISYEEVRSERYPIHLFVEGDPYKMWGVFPGKLHLFGTRVGVFSILGRDRGGRDLFSRMVYSSRVSVSIGLLGVAVSAIIGITIGGISGYYGGKIDLLIQRWIEAIRSIPTLPLWMGLSATLPPHWSVTKVYFAIVLIVSLVGWTELARVVRGKFLSLRSEDFVVAASIAGSGDAKIIYRHLLPSFLSHVIASLTLAIPGMILAETSLSFIGLGMQAPAMSWGVLLKNSQSIETLAKAPWLLTPAVAVVLCILAFNFVGDGMRDAADPYARP